MRATSRARAVRKSLARARRLLVGQVRATSRFRAVRESLLIFLGGVLRNLLGWGAKERERERRAQTIERTLYQISGRGQARRSLSLMCARNIPCWIWERGQARRRGACADLGTRAWLGCSTNVYALLTVSEV